MNAFESVLFYLGGLYIEAYLIVGFDKGIPSLGMKVIIKNWSQPFGLKGLTIWLFGFEFEIALTLPVPTPKRMCGHIDAQLRDMRFQAHAFVDLQSAEFSVGFNFPKMSLFKLIDAFIGKLIVKLIFNFYSCIQQTFHFF